MQAFARDDQLGRRRVRDAAVGGLPRRGRVAGSNAPVALSPHAIPLSADRAASIRLETMVTFSGVALWAAQPNCNETEALASEWDSVAVWARS